MQRSKRKAGRGALELLSGADSDDYDEAPARAPKSMKSDKVEKVRVWWPPTRDKERTGFSGAYWPASVHRKGSNYLEVEYDNGEREKVDPDNIFPFDMPIEFGKESIPLMVGEFVEVSNNSKTDPCAWVGCVETIGKKCVINYPFHDSPKELIKLELLRRARVWDDLDWKYIEVGQRWRAGEVTSPIELNLLTEEEYYKHLKQLGGKSSGGKGSRGKKPAAAATAPPSESEGSGSEQQDESSSGEEEQQPQPKKQSVTGRQRGRPRKPQHPTRSMLDEASNGTRDRKEEKPTGARKRKPAAVRQAAANTNNSSKAEGVKDAKQQQQQRTKQPREVAATAVTAANKNAAAAAVEIANKAAGGAAGEAAAPGAAAAAAVAAAAAASGPAGSAAASVTLTELMQGLSQPVLLLPAAAGQKTPMMLLLPKGTGPAGLAGIGRGAAPVPLQGAAGVAAAAGAAQGLGRGQGAAGAPGSGNSQGSSGAAAARVGALQQQAQLAAAAAASPHAGPSPRAPPALLNLFPAGTSQAAAAAEIDSQLALLDLTAARLALAQRYCSEAYLLLVDCWRADSPRLPHALRSFRANVLSLPQPDYQAFMIGIFGMDRMKALELQQQ